MGIAFGFKIRRDALLRCLRQYRGGIDQYYLSLFVLFRLFSLQATTCNRFGGAQIQDDSVLKHEVYRGRNRNCSSVNASWLMWGTSLSQTKKSLGKQLPQFNLSDSSFSN